MNRKAGKQMLEARSFKLRLFRYFSVAAILLAAPSIVSGEHQQNDQGLQTGVRQAEEAVKNLGSDDYATRLAANSSLLTLGRSAIEPLERALQSEDPEVRLRAMRLLITLRGCGYLGVVLAEDDDVDEQEPESRFTCVGVNAILSFRDPQFAKLKLEKPLPAESAGFQADDKMIAVNDRPLRGTNDFRREIISIGPARSVVFTIERDGKLLRLPVTLSRNPLRRQGEPETPPVDLEKER